MSRQHTPGRDFYWFAQGGGNADDRPIPAQRNASTASTPAQETEPDRTNQNGESEPQNYGIQIGYREREERARLLRERQVEERQRRLEEMKNYAIEAQRNREAQEEDRRRHFDELRHREQEHRAVVQDRKRMIDEAQLERKEAILLRSQEKESRAIDNVVMRRPPGSMSSSMHSQMRGGANSSYVFGSSTPRVIHLDQPIGGSGLFVTTPTGATANNTGGSRRPMSQIFVPSGQNAWDVIDSARGGKRLDSELIKRTQSSFVLDQNKEDISSCLSPELENSASNCSYSERICSPANDSYFNGDAMSQSMYVSGCGPARGRKKTDLLPAFYFTPRGESPRTRSPGMAKSMINLNASTVSPARRLFAAPSPITPNLSRPESSLGRHSTSMLQLSVKPTRASRLRARALSRGKGPGVDSSPSPVARSTSMVQLNGNHANRVVRDASVDNTLRRGSGECSTVSRSRPMSCMSVQSSMCSSMTSTSAAAVLLRRPRTSAANRQGRPVSVHGVLTAVNAAAAAQERESRSAEKKQTADSKTPVRAKSVGPDSVRRVILEKQATRAHPANGAINKTPDPGSNKANGGKTDKPALKPKPAHLMSGPIKLIPIPRQMVVIGKPQAMVKAKPRPPAVAGDVPAKTQPPKVPNREFQKSPEVVEKESVAPAKINYENEEIPNLIEIETETDTRSETVSELSNTQAEELEEEENLKSVGSDEPTTVENEPVSIATDSLEQTSPLTEQPSNVTMPVAKSTITTEEEAKAALALKRKEAKEKAEREAEQERQRLEEIRLEEEERLRQEEEALRQWELEQEAARREEERRLQEAIAERARQEAEEQQQREEEREEENRLRLEREEADRVARVEAEKARKEMEERLRREEEERLLRKKRVEAIMSRTRGKNTPPTATTPNKVNHDVMSAFDDANNALNSASVMATNQINLNSHGPPAPNGEAKLNGNSPFYPAAGRTQDEFASIQQQNNYNSNGREDGLLIDYIEADFPTHYRPQAYISNVDNINSNNGGGGDGQLDSSDMDILQQLQEVQLVTKNGTSNVGGTAAMPDLLS